METWSAVHLAGSRTARPSTMAHFSSYYPCLSLSSPCSLGRRAGSAGTHALPWGAARCGSLFHVAVRRRASIRRRSRSRTRFRRGAAVRGPVHVHVPPPVEIIYSTKSDQVIRLLFGQCQPVHKKADTQILDGTR